MKRSLAFLLVIIFSVSMVACSSETKKSHSKDREKDVDIQTESVEENNTQNDSTDVSEPPKDDVVLVTTAYEEEISDEFSDSSDDTMIFAIPQINLQGEYIDDLNQAIYNDYYEIISNVKKEIDSNGYADSSGGVSYHWGSNKEILSLVIVNQASPLTTPSKAYTVYNINIDSAQKASDEEVVATAGYTMDEFYDEVEVALGNEYISIYSNSGVYDSYRYDDFFAEQFDNTVSHSNVREVKPYIGEDGELYVVALVYSIAGAGAYYREVKVSGIDIHENYIEFTT